MWRNLRIEWDNDHIDCFVEKICMFCIIEPDSVRKPVRYQRCANSNENPNEIINADIETINTYGARSKLAVWQNVQDLSGALAAIPVNLDLFEIESDVWNKTRNLLCNVLKLCVSTNGIAIATTTKMLHLKRPALIPICDSRVMERLIGVHGSTSCIRKGLQCIEKMRSIGRVEANREVIRIACEHLKTCLPDANPYRQMPPLRVLEAVLWLETKERQSYWPLLGW